MIPTLETQRLRLRGHNNEDFANSEALWAHPVTYQFISGKPSTRQQSWARFLAYKGLWATRGYGYWLVEEKETGIYVGELGFGDFKRDMEPRIENLPEAGWVIHPDHHGKGYAEEAVKCVHKWLDENTSETKSYCIIDEVNERSVKLAHKLGYVKTGKAMFNGSEIVVFERKK